MSKIYNTSNSWRIMHKLNENVETEWKSGRATSFGHLIKKLEYLVVLTSEWVFEIGVEAEKGVLAEVWYFVPWIENDVVFVCAREGQLDPQAAIDRAALALATGCFDGTILVVEADEGGLTWTWRATISLPV